MSTPYPRLEKILNKFTFLHPIFFFKSLKLYAVQLFQSGKRKVQRNNEKPKITSTHLDSSFKN